MCAVSAIFDQYYDRWTAPPFVAPNTGTGGVQFTPWLPSTEEIQEFYDLLEKARKWDLEHNEPDCETAEKRQKLQDLAEELGIEIEFI